MQSAQSSASSKGEQNSISSGESEKPPPGAPFDFSWRIENWKELTKEAISPSFVCEGLKFYMKVTIPSQPNQFVAVKVVLDQQPPGPKTLQFHVTLKNKVPGKSILKKSSKAYSRMNAYETYMLTQSKNLNNDDGFFDEGALTILLHHPPHVPKRPQPATAQPKSLIPKSAPSVTEHYQPRAKVQSPPPVLPPQPPQQSSKELTGCVGIRNQGATCYMNSLLQSLFHLCAFRRLVYNIPTTGTENVNTSIPLNLQRLFCQLQLSDHSVSTTDLTKSFGWNQRETMQQQDVQEFCRVLMQNLENKLRNTDLASTIDNLFRGHTRTYIRCKNVPYKKEITEDFKDLSLVVKDCKNLEDSLNLELEPQVLDGDNMYQTDEYGKQEAVMGQEFTDFPSVLHVHLRRFDRDLERNTCVKINDRYEFPAEIDLKKFLAPDACNTKSQVYDLYGVLVHSGGSMCGHYYAFLRISQDPQWYRFDDQNVTKVTPEEAIQNNYGGKEGDHDKTYSGYMLIYVRRSDAPAIFEPIPDSSVPQHLRNYFEKSQLCHAADHGPIEVKVTDEDTVRNNSSKWTTGFDSASNFITVSIARDITYKALYETIAKAKSKDVNKLRLWKCGTYSIPHEVIPNTDAKIDSHFSSGSLIFCQDLVGDDKLQIEEGRICVFVKYFFSNGEPLLQYVGPEYPKPTDTLESLCEMVTQRVGLPKGTPLLCFQETVQKSAQLISTKTLGEAGINNGLVLIFQVTPGSEAPEPTLQRFKKPMSVTRSSSINDMSDLQLITYTDIYPDCKPITVDQYLEYKLRMLKVIVCSVTTPQTPSALLKFPSNLRWTAVKQFIAAALSLPYTPQKDSICLFKKDPNTNGPMKIPINSRLTPTMKSVIACSSPAPTTKEKPWLYFQLIPGIPEASVDSMINYNVQFSADAVNVDSNARLLMPKTCTINEIAIEMTNRYLIPRANSLRALAVMYHKIVEILDLKKSHNQPDATIRFEVVPIEHKNIKPDEHLVPVVRGYLDKFNMPRLSADPFLFLIKDNSTINSIKNDMLEWVDVNETLRPACEITVYEDKKLRTDIDNDKPIFEQLKGCSLMIVEPRPPKPKVQPNTQIQTSHSLGNAIRILN